MTITDVLRKFQGDRTQAEYAALLGITQGHLSLIYAGHRRPNLPIIHALAQQFPESSKEIADILAATPVATKQAVA